MDAATAVMACSPAYLAVVAQNLAEAGAAEGLDAGAGLRARASRRSPARSSSCGATTRSRSARRRLPRRGTEAGLEALADAGAGDAFQAAVRASLERMRP